MIRIRLINEGRVVKQITSRVHEGVVLEQINKYKDPFDTIQIVEGELSEDAKSMLQHVARKIIPAAMAAGVAMSGAGPAQAQGGANPNYPGMNYSVGQHMSDIFSPNYKEKLRQREHNRSTERQVWNAEQDEIRKQRVAGARASAGGGQQPVIYDQSRLSQDGKSYIIYGIDNKVRRIPVAGTEYMVGDSQRLPHYITSGGSVLYVRHPHAVTGVAESIGGSKDQYTARDAWVASMEKKYPNGKIATARSAPTGFVTVDGKTVARFPAKKVAEGYTVTRGIDKERYQERPGLEGPFSTKSGKVVYYDKTEGKYYDPDTDFYIGHDDYAKMDEAAPGLVKAAAGLALGGVAAAGAPALVAILGPLLGIPFAAYAAYSAAKLGIRGVEQLWDLASEKLGGDDKVAQYTSSKIATLPPEQQKAAVATVKQIGESKQGVVEDATVGTIPASGTVGTSGSMGQRTQFAPTGKTTNAKFNKNGQIELDTEQEADGSVNLDPAAVKQLQQAGVQIKENEDSPVAGAIVRRIMSQRLDLLKQYGPVLVTQAVDEVADFVGDVEEIGSSDVSGWVKHVEQLLGNMQESVTEGTDTLDGILSKFSTDYAKFKAGGDIDENQDFFDALYEYYFDEMPYGVKKARDGDPYEWITDRLDQESGISPVAEAVESMTPNWAKYVLDQIYNSDGAVTLTDLFDEGIPGLHDMFMATAKAHGLDPEEEFEDVQHELTVELEDIIKGGHGLVEAEEEEATPGDQAAADQNIIMQIRKASDYERPARIKLADGTESIIAPNIAKQLLAKFEKMKPESKALLQNTLNTEEGFKEILAYFGGGVREQAAARAGKIMQSAMAEAGLNEGPLDDVRARMDARRNPPAKSAANLPTTPRPPVPPYTAPAAAEAPAELKAGDIIGYKVPGSKMMPIKAKVLKLMSGGFAMVSVTSPKMIAQNNGSPVITIGPMKDLEIQNPYKELSTKPTATDADAPVAIMKEDTEDWLPAYKALAKNNGAPESLKFSDAYRNIIWKKQMALVAKANNITDRNSLQKFVEDYATDPDSAERSQYLAYEVEKLVAQAPSMAEMRKVLAQQPDTIHQQNITSIQNRLELENVPLQHELSVQALLNKVELDQADQKELLDLDMEARLAIVKMKQDLELDAKERLVQIEREIEDRKEREDVRKHELEMAQAGYKHEIAVIDATAQGEYKKAKLEADYQIQIKQLDNIDNAEERKGRLDQINAEKAKQLALIDSETKARVEVMQKEVDVEQQSSDIKIQSAFMMAFKDVWANSLSSAASAAGQAWDVGIANVKKALAMMSKPIMPTAQKESRYDRRDAYQRDYDSSVAGMGKHQSQAYQQDGGANDEDHAGDARREQQTQSGTWYIRLNGKLIRDKAGEPYTFRGKAAANKAALTMQAKLFNQGKEFMLTTNPNDKTA